MNIQVLAEELQQLKKEVAELKKELRKARTITAHCFSIAEIAEELGVSPRSIKEKIREGKLIERYPLAQKSLHRDDLEMFLRGKNPKRRLVL
jgi:DNA-directed RNA polymerase specialized sigma24 family protein